MFFVSLVTKYRYIHSLLLAMWENLFYHPKNQDRLTQLMHARLRFVMHLHNPSTAYIYFLR
ncbi:hypothetical protein AL524_25355 [Citrobacter amalonaticus]|nr:hypothetical protein AL524_25355 [Citrobacter amalonaticus]